MAIEPAVRYHPARWIILGPVLFASLFSMGLALLAVLGAPPWGPSPGTAARPIHPTAVGEKAGGQQAGGPLRPVTADTADTSPPEAADPAPPPLGAAPSGTAYRTDVIAAHRTYGYQRSLLYSGLLGLAIALAGLTMVGRRRQMW